MSRFYFHCSDGVDLVLDREGIEIEASDVLLSALRAAERLIRALPSYDDYASSLSPHPPSSRVHLRPRIDVRPLRSGD